MFNKYEVVTMSDSYYVTKTEHDDLYEALEVYEECIKDENIIKCKIEIVSRNILLEQERGE